MIKVRLREVLAVAFTTAVVTPLVLWDRRPAGPAPYPGGCPAAFPSHVITRDAMPDGSWTLSKLTAWRRLRGEPDPARIEVVSERRVELPFPKLPTFEVVLRNVDVDGNSFRIYCDEDWGPSFWRFRARPLEGPGDWGYSDPAPARFHKGSNDRLMLVEPGEVACGTDEGSSVVYIHLKFFGFPEAPRPGPNTFRLEYGSAERFFEHAHHERCEPMAVSAPLEFEWRPITVSPGPEIVDQVKRAIDDLAARRRVTVGDRALTGLDGWVLESVPALLDELEASKDDLHRRAVVLATLHAATGLVDPLAHSWTRRTPGPLGRYGWRNSDHRGDDGGPSREAQDPLVARWRRLSELVQVR